MQQNITPSVVLRHLRRKLGALLQTLELTDEQMMTTFFQTTLPEFSKYFPFKYRVVLSEKDRIKTKEYAQLYKIPNKDNLQIINLHNMWNMNSTSYVTSPAVLSFYVDPFSQQLLSDQLSATTTPSTWEFVAPDMVNIKPVYLGSDTLIEVKAVHPKHLRTVPIGLKEALLQLATLDVLESLWPLRARIQSMQSPFGQIELFMSQVESASSERQQLLDKFSEQVLRSANAKKIWIA